MTCPVVWPLLFTDTAGVDGAALVLLLFESTSLLRRLLASADLCLWWSAWVEEAPLVLLTESVLMNRSFVMW